jgi:hypothetical protein
VSRFWHGVFHGVCVVGQVALASSPYLPFPFNVAAAGSIATIQGIVALKHHK